MHVGNLRHLRPMLPHVSCPPRRGFGVGIALALLLTPGLALARGTALAGADADEDLEDLGARATGSGMVGVANPNDIGALRLNLATASLAERYELYTGAELGPMGHLGLRAGAMDSRTGPVAFGLGYRRLTDKEWLKSGEKPGWKADGETFQNPTEHSGLYAGLAYPFANRRGSAAVDARYDWYTSDLLDQDAAFNFGISAAFRPADTVVLAAAIDNLLENDFRDTERELRLGARWDAGTYFGIEGDALAPVTTTWDWKQVEWRAGANVGVAEFLSIHAGYANDATLSWVTGGLGFMSEKCDLDYGMRVRLDEPWHNVHTLDLRIRI